MPILERMKEFPKKFTPSNLKKFSEYNRIRLKAYLRRDVYESVLSGDDAFHVDSFVSSRKISTDLAKELMRELSEELKHLGWNTALLYNDTALYTYGEETPGVIREWTGTVSFL